MGAGVCILPEDCRDWDSLTTKPVRIHSQASTLSPNPFPWPGEGGLKVIWGSKQALGARLLPQTPTLRAEPLSCNATPYSL